MLLFRTTPFSRSGNPSHGFPTCCDGVIWMCTVAVGCQWLKQTNISWVNAPEWCSFICLFVGSFRAKFVRHQPAHRGKCLLPPWLGRILTIDVLAARPGMFGKESPMESMHWGEGSSQDQATCFLQPKNRKATTVAENRISCPSLVLGNVFQFIFLLGSTVQFC